MRLQDKGESRGRGGALTEAAIVARPDELRGELVVAFVVYDVAKGAFGKSPEAP